MTDREHTLIDDGDARSGVSTMVGVSASFEADLTESIRVLRQGLTEALAALRVGVDAPQEVARRLGISRNLTWKVSKVICSPDVFEATQHLPGEEGLSIFVQALEDAGLPLSRLEGLRDWSRKFDRVVERHAGDRATLDLILDGMGPASASRLEQSRKMAFRGSSGVWGIQARARMTTLIVAPTIDSADRVDMVLLGGLADVRRLRPHVTWPIFYPRSYHDDGTPMSNPNDEPVDPTMTDPHGPMLMREFCSPTMPEIRVRRGRTGPVYEFGPGPVGNSGAFSMAFGILTRGQVSRFQSPEDQWGESTTQITMPTSALQFDVMLHRDLRFGRPEAAVLGRITVPMGDEQLQEIPIAEQPREVTGRPAMISSTLIPRYESMVQRAMERAGWTLDDFAVHRLVMQYPPMHSVVRVRFGLEAR